MFRQVVDLAARFSAVVLREEGGEVRAQYDSRDKSAFAFAAEIALNPNLTNIRLRASTALDPECSVTLVEDVPYGISSQAMVKPVLRLQGILMMASWKTIDQLYFVAPTTWMPKFPGVQSVPAAIGKGMTKTQKDQWRIDKAAEYARGLGYTPPDLVQAYIDANPGAKILKKHTGPLEKSMTDYVSAFLMSEALSAYNDQDLPSIQGIQVAQI